MSEWLSLELDDDPATLHAALAMIDSLDTSGDGVSDLCHEEYEIGATSGSGCSESQSPPPQAMKEVVAESEIEAEQEHAKHTKRPLSRREEILQLRDSVAELESSLATLRKRRRMADAVVNQERVADEDLTLAVVWESIAQRQRALRHGAEHEHQRLREMLQSQVSVGQRLMELLRQDQRRSNTDGAALMEAAALNHRMTEEQLMADVDELYGQADQAFSAPRFRGVGSLMFRDIRASDEGDDTTRIDTQASWVVPWPVDNVRYMLWILASDRMGSPGCPVHNPQTIIADNMITTSFGSVPCGNERDITQGLYGRVVTKHFREREDQPAVVVSSMRGEATGVIAGSARELMLLQEHSWIRVRGVNTVGDTNADQTASPSAGQAPLAQVQVSRRITLRFAATHFSDRQRVTRALTELVLTQLENALTWKQQMLENLVLEELRGGNQVRENSRPSV